MTMIVYNSMKLPSVTTNSVRGISPFLYSSKYPELPDFESKTKNVKINFDLFN